ncbi:MAG TPA: NfeD family protein [Gaiellaceae bacterium]|jgi:membrane-bound serine protease (ClpP class)
MLLIGAVIVAVLFLPSPWGVVLVIVGGLVEIGEATFWYRFSRRHRARVGAETLVGSVATVTEPCHPVGQARLVGELWEARCEAGADRGDKVRVVALDGLALVVEPVGGAK